MEKCFSTCIFWKKSLNERPISLMIVSTTWLLIEQNKTREPQRDDQWSGIEIQYATKTTKEPARSKEWLLTLPTEGAETLEIWLGHIFAALEFNFGNFFFFFLSLLLRSPLCEDQRRRRISTFLVEWQGVALLQLKCQLRLRGPFYCQRTRSREGIPLDRQLSSTCIRKFAWYDKPLPS